MTSMFWLILLILSAIKGFQVSYVWNYIVNGTEIKMVSHGDKTFIASALITAFVYAITAILSNDNLDIIGTIDLLAVCVLVSFTDIKHRHIPNVVILLLLVSQLTILACHSGVDGFLNVIWCIVVLVIAMLISILSKGQMGMGDVKLLSIICLTIGIAGLFWVFITALALSFLCGMYLMLSKKMSIKTEMPFAPFITLSLLINIITNIL